MPTSDEPSQPLAYAAPARSAARTRRLATAWAAACLNCGVAAWCVWMAGGLAPQFDDATSRHGVVVPLVFRTMPLLTAAATLLAFVARGTDARAGRVAVTAAWAVAATWAAVALLLFRPWAWPAAAADRRRGRLRAAIGRPGVSGR